MLNEKLLTVEDANSVLKHFGKGFCDYYTLDTRLLTTVDTWFAWDFIDVYRVTGSISFSVKNSLWTGGYRVLDSNISNPSVSVANGTITVSGTDLEWVVLLLELSPEFSHSTIFELDYEVEYTPVIRPFYEEFGLTMGFLDGDDPVVGLTVTDKIIGETLTTDSDGLVTVLTGPYVKGDFDYVLESVNNGVTVDYRFPYVLIPVELPVILLNPVVYRDKVNRLVFRFLYDEEYSVENHWLFDDNIIQLRVDGQVYDLDEYNINDDMFWFDVPVGLSEHLRLSLVVTGNRVLDNYKVEMDVATSFVTVSSSSALNSELSSDNPAGTIVFSGDEFESSVSVNSNILLRFNDDVVSNLDNVFTVSDGATLTLDTVNFEGKGLVNLDNGNLNLVNGSFQHCTGTIVKGTGDLTADVCTFIDNTSCIDIIGDIRLENVLFDLSDTDYPDTSTPAFIRCTDELSVDYCQFNLELTGLTSLGLSYVMLLLGKNGSVNGVLNNNLFANDVFPVNHNTGSVDVESTNYRFSSIGNKCMVWSVMDTNTVYYNNLHVEYIGGE